MRRGSRMTGWFGRTVKRFLRTLKDSRGVTLYETTAVAAMTAIVAAIAIPVAMDKIDNSKESAVSSCLLYTSPSPRD